MTQDTEDKQHGSRLQRRKKLGALKFTPTRHDRPCAQAMRTIVTDAPEMLCRDDGSVMMKELQGARY